MSDYLIQEETLVNLADAVRTLSDTTDEMTPDEMIATINATQSVIDNLTDHVYDLNNPHEVTAA